jgi:hypothetical protein
MSTFARRQRSKHGAIDRHAKEEVARPPHVTPT